MAITAEGEKAVIKAGRSRFSLSTLPAAEFPVIEDINSQQTVQIPRKDLSRLLEKTHFSMAQQDVRYYLNGMLLEIDGQLLRAVATDGHRLALSESDARGQGQDLAAGDRAAQRACSSCSACSTPEGTPQWRSAAITFVRRLAMFDSLRS